MDNFVRTVTGTTGGDTPVFDGTMRGSLVAILNTLIGLATVSDWVDTEQAVYIALIVNPFVFFMWGIWDALMKDRDAEIQKALDLLLQAQAEGNRAAIALDAPLAEDIRIEPKPPTARVRKTPAQPPKHTDPSRKRKR